MKMLFRGFRFGMLLQIAVGPVCLFIFHTAAAAGLIAALTGVAGVVLADALYIVAAIEGVGALLSGHKKVGTAMRYFGAAVLIIFGIANLLGALHISFLPKLHLAEGAGGGSAFLAALLLTLANPLTILFWAGVFSARMAEENLQKRQVYAFGSGAMLSTLFFLAAISLLGTLAKVFLSETVAVYLNAGVGAVLIFFGVHAACKKEEAQEAPPA